MLSSAKEGLGSTLHHGVEARGASSGYASFGSAVPKRSSSEMAVDGFEPRADMTA